ncbi:MAG: pentapeptide repeat-containing protein, partial [Patescibacteria group bacterium]
RANLTDMNLRGMNFRGANLADADLSGTLLDGTDFDGANLRGAKFVGARFGWDTKITSGQLARAVFWGARDIPAELLQRTIATIVESCMRKHARPKTAPAADSTHIVE